MLGDGKTRYDQPNDGEAHKIGACSANYRRTNVATKLKITYIKDTYLNVSIQATMPAPWRNSLYLTGPNPIQGL